MLYMCSTAQQLLLYKYIMTQHIAVPTKIQDNCFVWLHHISQLPMFRLKNQHTTECVSTILESLNLQQPV